MKVKQVVIKTSKEIHSSLKIQAINEGVKLHELVDRILSKYLAEKSN